MKEWLLYLVRHVGRHGQIAMHTAMADLFQLAFCHLCRDLKDLDEFDKDQQQYRHWPGRRCRACCKRPNNPRQVSGEEMHRVVYSLSHSPLRNVELQVPLWTDPEKLKGSREEVVETVRGIRPGFTHYEFGDPITSYLWVRLKPAPMYHVVSLMRYCSSKERAAAHQLLGTEFTPPRAIHLRGRGNCGRYSARGFETLSDVDEQVAVLNATAEMYNLRLTVHQTTWRGPSQRLVLWLSDSTLDARNSKGESHCMARQHPKYGMGLLDLLEADPQYVDSFFVLWVSAPGARPSALTSLLLACPSAYMVHVFSQGNGYERMPEPGDMPRTVIDLCALYIHLLDGHVHSTFDVMADASMWGLGPDYALVRIMALDSLVRLSRDCPGVIVTSGKWLTGLQVEAYGQSPHVSDASWKVLQNNLHEAYAQGREDKLGEVDMSNWPLCYGRWKQWELSQYGPVNSTSARVGPSAVGLSFQQQEQIEYFLEQHRDLNLARPTDVDAFHHKNVVPQVPETSTFGRTLEQLQGRDKSYGSMSESTVFIPSVLRDSAERLKGVIVPDDSTGSAMELCEDSANVDVQNLAESLPHNSTEVFASAYDDLCVTFQQHVRPIQDLVATLSRQIRGCAFWVVRLGSGVCHE